MASDRKTQIIVAVIAGGFAIAVALLTWHLNSPPTDKKTPYQGRVIDDGDSGVRIKGAEVSVHATGVPHSVYTDDKGIFHLDLSGAPQTIRVSVYAKGYQPFDQIVPIVNGQLSDIRLKRQPESPSPTPTIQTLVPSASPRAPVAKPPTSTQPPAANNANRPPPAVDNTNRLEQRRQARNALDNNN